MTRARKKAMAFSVDVDEGLDPAAPKKETKAERFCDVVEVYLSHLAKQPEDERLRSYDNISRMLNTYFDKVWKLNARNIKRSQFIAIIEEIQERAPYQGNRVLAVVRQMYNWFIK
jgi:hypothetical protein